jgi:hypothetical protein
MSAPDTSMPTPPDMSVANPIGPQQLGPQNLPPVNTDATLANTLGSGQITSMTEGTQPDLAPVSAMTEGTQPASTPTVSNPSDTSSGGGLWRKLLVGALDGLAGSAGGKNFGDGAARGAAAAIENPMIRQEAADKHSDALASVKWKSAEAAGMVADANIKSLQLHNLPSEIQYQHDSQAINMVNSLKSLGLDPTMVIPNTHDSAAAALNQISDANGGVGHMYTVALNKQLIAFNLDDLADKKADENPVLKSVVNVAGQLNGRPDIDNKTWDAMEPKAKVAILENSFNALNTAPPTAANVASLAATAQNQLSNYTAQPSWKQKPEVVKQLQNKLAFYKGAAQPLYDSQTAAVGRAQAAKSKAEADAKTVGAGSLLVGSLADGSQVAGTQDQLNTWGATGVTKLAAADGSKVLVSRQLIAPNGLFQAVASDISNLQAKGKLGTAASRWNDFMAGKVGSEPDFAPLRTDMGLLGTALMQSHVGAKGSDAMLEHFKSLADYRISDAPTLLAALSAEHRYVSEKAMLPKQKPANAQGGK